MRRLTPFVLSSQGMRSNRRPYGSILLNGTLTTAVILSAMKSGLPQHLLYFFMFYGVCLDSTACTWFPRTCPLAACAAYSRLLAPLTAAGSLFRAYPGPWQVLRRNPLDAEDTRLVWQSQEMPTLKQVALEILAPK